MGSTLVNNGNPYLFGSLEVSDSFDCNFCRNCKGCYECISCFGCEEVYFSRLATNCSESSFLDNCINCKQCLFCSNLKDAEYCVFNQQLGVDEYFATLRALGLGEEIKLEHAKERFNSFLKLQPIYYFDNGEGYSQGYPLEDEGLQRVEFYSKGNVSSSSTFSCMDLNEAFSTALCFGPMKRIFNSALIDGRGEEVFRSLSCFGAINDLDLCIGCRDSKHLFGCVGLVGQSYCIFNYQFDKAEYLVVRHRLEAQFREEGFGSSFLPSQARLIPYNHSLAGVLFPLVKSSQICWVIHGIILRIV